MPEIPAEAVRPDFSLPLRRGNKPPHQTIYALAVDGSEVMVAAAMTPDAAAWLVQVANQAPPERPPEAEEPGLPIIGSPDVSDGSETLTALRERYAEALTRRLRADTLARRRPSITSVNSLTPTADDLADAVLGVRDEEMAALKAALARVRSIPRGPFQPNPDDVERAYIRGWQSAIAALDRALDGPAVSEEQTGDSDGL